MSRGFEVVKGYEDKNINLPVRKTKFAAGYDIEAAEDIVIPSFKKGMAPTLIPTGIKAYMEDDEVLYLYNRSSNPKKKGLILANSVGVIDKDYYNSPKNEGHIFIKLYNEGTEDYVVHKNDKIVQGLFIKFLIVDNEEEIENERDGWSYLNN